MFPPALSRCQSARPVLGAAVLLLLMLSGCGSKTATVRGRVTLDGQPLKAGMVTFNPTGAKQTVSAEINNGNYTLEKVMLGPGTFTVDTGDVAKYLTQAENAANVPGLDQMSDQQRQKLQDGLKKQMSPELAKRYEGAQLVPPVYASSKSSRLSYTVRSGSQDHDIALTSQGP